MGRAMKKGKICKGEKYSPIMVLYCCLASQAKTEWLKKQGVNYSSRFCGLDRWLFSVCPGLRAGAFSWNWAGWWGWLGLSLQVGLMGLQHSAVAGICKNESKAARALKYWAEQLAESLHPILLIKATPGTPPPRGKFQG